MKDIYSLSCKHSDYEIMEILKIPNQTYYRYKTRMYEEAKRQWNQERTESLEYRALMIRKALELCIKVNEEIATDPNQPAKDRTEAGKVMVEAEVHLAKLLKHGPNTLLD